MWVHGCPVNMSTVLPSLHRHGALFVDNHKLYFLPVHPDIQTEDIENARDCFLPPIRKRCNDSWLGARKIPELTCFFKFLVGDRDPPAAENSTCSWDL